MEERSLSIITELSEHSEPSHSSTTQNVRSPRPFSAGVQNIMKQLSDRKQQSCSSRCSAPSSVWSENESMSLTATDLSPQSSTISNSSMSDEASMSPETLEETILNQQFYSYNQLKEASSENIDHNNGYCRNENAKERVDPLSLMSSREPCELSGAMGAMVEHTKGCTDTSKTENKTESKIVHFKNNVIVHQSPWGGADTKSSGNQKTTETLSDLPSEGLRIGEDYKARRPATPGKLLNVGETTASPTPTPTPTNIEKEAMYPLQTVKDPDYTPRTPRNRIKAESGKGNVLSLYQFSADSQQTLKSQIEETKRNLLVQEGNNSSSWANDVPSDLVCAKRSQSKLDIATDETNGDRFGTSEKASSGEECQKKKGKKKNMSDVNVVGMDREELDEKARRRADRKKRKEMRMAAEGHIQEQENLPQEEKCRKKLKKSGRIQKRYSEEPAEQQDYRQQAFMRLEAEKDTADFIAEEDSQLGIITTQEDNQGDTVTFEDKLQHWEKMKRKGDIRSLRGHEEANKPAGKMKSKKKKKQEQPATGDESIDTEKEIGKDGTQTELDIDKEDTLGPGEEAGGHMETMENVIHEQKKAHHKYKEHKDGEIHTHKEDHSKSYPQDHSMIGLSDANFQGEICKEKLCQEERRKKRAKKKKMKEAKASENENLIDSRKEYPYDQVTTQMTKEDSGYGRHHVQDQDKLEEMQQEIAEILGLSSNAVTAQRVKQELIMGNKDTDLVFKEEQPGENQIPDNFKEHWFENERDSATTGFQKGKNNTCADANFMNITGGERIKQHKSGKKKKVKNFNEDKLPSSFTAENHAIQEGYTVISDSVSHNPQTVLNEDGLDIYQVPFTSQPESNKPVHSQLNKKYVNTGVGPTQSEDVSLKSGSESRTEHGNSTNGEHGNISKKMGETRDNVTHDKVRTTDVTAHKPAPGGHFNGQQYSVDHQHKAQTQGNHGLVAEQDGSLETSVVIGNRKGHFDEGESVTNRLSKYLRKRDGSDHVTVTTRDGDPVSISKGDEQEQMLIPNSQDVKEHHQTVIEQHRPTPVGCDVDLATEIKPGVESAVKPQEELAVKPAVELAVKTGVESAVRSGGESAVKPGEELAVKSGVESAVKSGVESAVKSGVESAFKPGVESVVKLKVESAVRRVNQMGAFSGSLSRPESRSLWSNSTMNIPHSIQEEDETEESEDQTGQDPSDTTPEEDQTEGMSYLDTRQDTGQNSNFKPLAPREELAPNVFKVDKMNLPPVCVAQKEDKTNITRKPGPSPTDKEQDIRMPDAIRLFNTQVKVDEIQRSTSPELDDLLLQYRDLKSEVEASLIPEQTWEEITKPKGQFRPKARVSVDKPPGIQDQKFKERNDEWGSTNPTPTMPPSDLNKKQRAHYEKLQVTFRAPEKNLPGAQFWKDLSADKVFPEAVPQDLFIKKPFGNVLPNEFEDEQMSPIKGYRNDRNRSSDAALDETGYESMEQSDNYDNSPQSLSELRNKLRKLCSEQDDSNPHSHPQSPTDGAEMNEVSTDPRFWKSHDMPSTDSSRLSAEVLSRIANCAAENEEMIQFADENSSYQDEQFQEGYKEPSYAPSLIDRYHAKKEENLDFFRCVSRGIRDNRQTLRTEEETIARSFARKGSRENTVDDETADSNLLFFKTVARYPAFYEPDDETADSKVVKSGCGRRSPGYIPDDPSNYISGEVAHQNLEFFRAVAKDTSFFELPQKNDQESDADSDEGSTSRNRLEADPPLQKNHTSHQKDRSHHLTKMCVQKPAFKKFNSFQHKSLLHNADSQKTSPRHPTNLYSKRNDGLSLLQPVVSPGKARENMDFFLQVSKDPHFYKIGDKPEAPVMVAPDNKPKPYKSFDGINVNSGRHIGKKGLGFKSKYT